MEKIESSIFFNFTVDYGGAFFIQIPVDLYIKNVLFSKISTYSSTKVNNYDVGGSAFIFGGNNFFGSSICCDSLTATSTSFIYTYVKDQKFHNQLNHTSVMSGNCLRYAVLLGKGNCFSHDFNCTRLQTTQQIPNLHFGWSPISYHQTICNCINNTGLMIFGHSCINNSAQIAENVAIIDNKATSALFARWESNHRFVNCYFLRNTNCDIYSFQSGSLFTFIECYSDKEIKSLDGTLIYTEYPKTFYSNEISFASAMCDVLDYQKKCVIFRTISCSKQILKSIFFLILEISN
jgi:hypothetical protein